MVGTSRGKVRHLVLACALPRWAWLANRQGRRPREDYSGTPDFTERSDGAGRMVEQCSNSSHEREPACGRSGCGPSGSMVSVSWKDAVHAAEHGDGKLARIGGGGLPFPVGGLCEGPVGAALIFPTLRNYQKHWLGPDLLAGVTLVAIAVPEQMATARLAGMPPLSGLYAFVAGSLVFAALGRSRQLSVGADSTIAPVLAAGVASVAAAGTARYLHLVSFLALLVGVIVVAVGFLRLGWIAQFLSTPVVTGVLAGIAIEIVVRQIPAVLGLSGAGVSTFDRLRSIAGQLGHINVWSAGIAVAVFTVIVAARRIDERIPGALIALVASVLLVAVFHLKTHGVAVLGAIHGGLPTFAVPLGSLADARSLLGAALTIAFLCVAQTAATVRTAAPSVADFNHDLVALGAGSVVAGLAGSFAVNSSPPRTEIVTASGGRSQIASLVAAAVVVTVAVAASRLLQDLPLATLGAILGFVATRLFRIGDLRRILRFDRVEFVLAMSGLVAVAVLGIEQGIVVAMLLCLADRTRRASRPRDVVLGREPGTSHWMPPDIGRPTVQAPGVVVYLLYGPLWYGNADHVTARIHFLVGAASPPVHTLVLDADAMSDIDYTGSKALGGLISGLSVGGVTTLIARSSHLVHRNLKHSGLLEVIGPAQLFPTVEEAVRAAAPHST